ncbi:Uncharacterised protein [Segatella copri]|nr:Uncharacterised protein [Segatella copri]
MLRARCSRPFRRMCSWQLAMHIRPSDRCSLSGIRISGRRRHLIYIVWLPASRMVSRYWTAERPS